MKVSIRYTKGSVKYTKGSVECFKDPTAYTRTYSGLLEMFIEFVGYKKDYVEYTKGLA